MHDIYRKNMLMWIILLLCAMAIIVPTIIKLYFYCKSSKTKYINQSGTMQKIFLIWIYRQTKNFHSPKTITYLSKSLVPVLITKSKYQNSWNIGRHNCSWFIKTLPKFFFCQINWKTQIICFSASLSPFCNSGNRRHLAADWSTLPKFPSHQKVRLTNNNFSGFFSDSVFSC